MPRHAVNERRPLRRRSATIARPARVRIRNRNPCTRARRRLLGWKVRLPLATAVTPCYVWPLRPAGMKARGSGPQSAFWIRSSVSQLLTGAAPGHRRIAAVSPRAGDCLRVLTRVRWVKPAALPSAVPSRASPPARPRLSLSSGTTATPANLHRINVAELLALGKKTVSFCQCRFHVRTARDNRARITTPPRAHGMTRHRDELRATTSTPVDNAAATNAPTPQPVDNFVDSSLPPFWPTLGRPLGSVAH